MLAGRMNMEWLNMGRMFHICKHYLCKRLKYSILSILFCITQSRHSDDEVDDCILYFQKWSCISHLSSPSLWSCKPLVSTLAIYFAISIYSITHFNFAWRRVLWRYQKGLSLIFNIYPMTILNDTSYMHVYLI